MSTRTHAILGKYVIFHLDTVAEVKQGFAAALSTEPLKTLSGLPSRLKNKAGALQGIEGSQKNETADLVSLSEGAEDNLFTAHTVFPFVLFTDTLKIDRQKLTIVHHAFFRTSQTISTRLKDITNIQANVGPIFGSVTITSKHFLNNTQTIKSLKRKDIVTAQRLIQGFMIAHEADIDTDNVDQSQLTSLLLKIGQENK
jgi:hypothetical protein